MSKIATVTSDDFLITFGLTDNANADLMVHFARFIGDVHKKRDEHVSRQYVEFQANSLVGEFLAYLSDGVRLPTAQRIDACLYETEYMYGEAVTHGLIVASEECPHCAATKMKGNSEITTGGLEDGEIGAFLDDLEAVEWEMAA
jgi:hypothetical protein